MPFLLVFAGVSTRRPCRTILVILTLTCPCGCRSRERPDLPPPRPPTPGALAPCRRFLINPLSTRNTLFYQKTPEEAQKIETKHRRTKNEGAKRFQTAYRRCCRLLGLGLRLLYLHRLTAIFTIIGGFFSANINPKYTCCWFENVTKKRLNHRNYPASAPP